MKLNHYIHIWQLKYPLKKRPFWNSLWFLNSCQFFLYTNRAAFRSTLVHYSSNNSCFAIQISQANPNCPGCTKDFRSRDEVAIHVTSDEIAWLSSWLSRDPLWHIRSVLLSIRNCLWILWSWYLRMETVEFREFARFRWNFIWNIRMTGLIVKVLLNKIKNCHWNYTIITRPQLLFVWRIDPIELN